MIIASIFRNSKHQIWGFQIKGHSGYAEEGSDIICAAVSVLAINTVNALEQLVGMRPVTEVADGLLSCELPEIREVRSFSSEADLLLRTLELGLEAVMASYGKQYLKIVSEQKS